MRKNHVKQIENKMETPERIREHSAKYMHGAWRNYDFEELAQWISLLSKRATHRTELAKKVKDLDDAENYLAMLNAKFDELHQAIMKHHYDTHPEDDVQKTNE